MGLGLSGGDELFFDFFKTKMQDKQRNIDSRVSVNVVTRSFLSFAGRTDDLITSI